MDAHLHARQQRQNDVEDVAADYIEQEVGRHDWKNNWKYLRANDPQLAHKISAWLERTGRQQTAENVIEYMDRLARTVVGRWT